MTDNPPLPIALPAPPRKRRRPRRLRARFTPLSVPQILAWADDHFERTGRWPTSDCGDVLADRNEKWRNIDAALSQGCRGLCAAPRKLVQ
jgi:hypothetical protein